MSTALWVIAALLLAQLVEHVVIHRALRRHWNSSEARAQRHEKQAERDAARERQMEGWQSMLNAVRSLAGQAKEQLERERQAEVKRQLKERTKRRRQRIKAEGLLRMVLSDAEWQDYRRHGSVRIRTPRGFYEVGGRDVGHVYRLNEQGIPTAKLCYSLTRGYCKEDNLAAAILGLRLREEEFLSRTHDNPFYEREKERVALRRVFREAA